MYSPVAAPIRITSDFGPRNSRGGAISSNHGGVDFGARSGTLIRAAVPGVVIGASYAGTFGNLVKVRHTDGTIGYYAHMSSLGARIGQRVSRGTPIGRVGSTGRSTGNHLHFEVRRNGRSVNPMPWLSKDYRTVATRDAKDARSSFSGGRGVGGLSSEQLRNARIIISVGRRMGASQRDLVISLMTAYQESRLRNLSYGDRDSIGLFQQRNAWGSRSARLNPYESARMFFQGGRAGQPGLFDKRGRGRMSLTQAAQAVQVSAFPNAYAQWEGLARSILGGNATLGPDLGLDAMPEEEPLDGMLARTPSGALPLDAVHLPGVSRPEPSDLGTTQTRGLQDQGPLNRSTNEPDLRELLYGN